jgi:RimJ/RimL family protein N-acetyltransferase
VLPATAALSRRVGWEPPWICYLAVEGRRVVGTCGFKAPPHDDAVEIAYFTFPSHEGRGIATRMAAHLLAVADLAIPRPGAVTAETLPAESASTAILRRLGFTPIGERLDPEDGRVWQWRTDL